MFGSGVSSGMALGSGTVIDERRRGRYDRVVFSDLDLGPGLGIG